MSVLSKFAMSDTLSDSESNDSIFEALVILPDIPVSLFKTRIRRENWQRMPKSDWWTSCYPYLQSKAYKKIYRMSRSTVKAWQLNCIQIVTLKTMKDA